jgi:hypothetical protein
MKRQTWTDRVRNVYSSLEDLQAYDEIYDIANRCGYQDPESLWDDNPLIGGSVNPRDFGLAGSTP